MDGGLGGGAFGLPDAGKWLHLEILLDPEEPQEGSKELARRLLNFIYLFIFYSTRSF